MRLPQQTCAWRSFAEYSLAGPAARARLQNLPTVLLVVCLAGCLPATSAHSQTLHTASGKPQPTAQSPAVGVGEIGPVAVALSVDRRWCVTANRDAGTASLVDLSTGTVSCEVSLGRQPADVAWIDEQQIAVSLRGDDSVVLLQVSGNQLTLRTRIPVGDEPRGLARFAPLPVESDPQRASQARAGQLAVAVSGFDEVAVIDLVQAKVVRHLPVGGIPESVAVSPDGRWLVTCCSVPGEFFVHDAATFELISRRRIFDEGFNVGVPIIPADSSCCIFPSSVNRTFPVTRDNIERGWVIDQRLTKFPLPAGEYWEQQQLGLDERGRATADAHGAALSPDERLLAITCGGTHELLVLEYATIPWPTGNPPDFLPDELHFEPKRFRRIELGGRPLGVEFLDATHVVVANALSNSVQVVDAESGTILRNISLGGPETPSLARRGEAIFYDAERSFHQWFSCHTCHTEGHTCGQRFDTLNDGNYDTSKLVPTLRGVSRTSPWTWHGWQTSLDASVRKSLVDTLHTEKAMTDDDIHALVAFMQTLEHPPSPYQPSEEEPPAEWQRGKALFHGKADCVSCHAPPDFTTDATYDVGMQFSRHAYESLNPPTLRGIHSRRFFLHDGRADSLQKVLQRFHRPGTLAGEELTPEELHDLLVYLKSL